MNRPEVAVILVNWNNHKDTVECLDSFSDLSYKNFKVYLVDNKSTDNSVNLINEHIASKKYTFTIDFIMTEKNLGFAGGNNVALRKAYNSGSKYFWLLNNDTITTPNSLTNLVNCMEKNEKIGIVGSKIYYNNSDIIWFVGGTFDPSTGRTRHISFKHKDSGQYKTPFEVNYISGCSMMIRREVIRDIGFMSEDFFLYYEEVDYNIKAEKYNWKIVVEPNSVIYHKVSISSGGEKNLAPYVAYYDLRNGFWVCKRNFKGLHFKAFVYLLLKTFKKILRIYSENQDRKFVRLKYIIKGVNEALFTK
ncbi:glycosyltransferase family 2 protein [Sporolactobacillus spathodeae]|uniref:GT2 family glycosyltransferase n=1 Tax=Sporolactobacillus spathodeae TaxID=1465502 RepID=A0ABS2Q9Z5_9BACL|nr:glycosyltransferase family 2 protein [Sporolactobacillus spathodeae]MBM7657792.1 GT2 family glycosyltransferase [Sporolactobacillus spathodeae]